MFKCKQKIVLKNKKKYCSINSLPLRIDELYSTSSCIFEKNTDDNIFSSGIYILHNNTCLLLGEHVYKIKYYTCKNDIVTTTTSLIPTNPNKIIYFFPCLDLKKIEHVYTSLECFYIIKHYYECHISRLKRTILYILTS